MKPDPHFRQWRKMAATLGDRELRERIKTGAGDTDDVFFGSARQVDAAWIGDARAILDFGAGLGRNAPPMLALGPHVDPLLYDSPEMIERAKAKLRARLAPEEFDRLAFSSDWAHVCQHAFDLVFCCLVAQHIRPAMLLDYLADMRRIAPRLLVFGRRWNDAAGQASSTWELIARAGWRVVRCDDTFAIEQGPEIHNRVLFER